MALTKLFINKVCPLQQCTCMILDILNAVLEERWTVCSCHIAGFFILLSQHSGKSVCMCVHILEAISNYVIIQINPVKQVL